MTGLIMPWVVGMMGGGVDPGPRAVALADSVTLDGANASATVDLGPSNPYRTIVVAYSNFDNTSDQPSAFTLGGVSMTQAGSTVTAGSALVCSQIWYVDYPSGTSATLSCTSGIVEDGFAYVYAITGGASAPTLNQTVSDTNSSGATLQLNVNLLADDVCVAAGICLNGNPFSSAGFDAVAQGDIRSGEYALGGRYLSTSTQTPRTMSVDQGFSVSACAINAVFR